MIISTINRIIRNKIKNITFPKLPTKEYNKLWKVSQNKFIKLPITEIVQILRCIILKLGPGSLIAIPSIIYIKKIRNIRRKR